jgi:hypothetical protein
MGVGNLICGDFQERLRREWKATQKFAKTADKFLENAGRKVHIVCPPPKQPQVIVVFTPKGPHLPH